MKKWEKYKWSEVLTIKNGKSQKKVVNPKGQYPIYGSGGIMGYADDYLCPENTTIIGRKGSINKPIYVIEKFWNVDTAFGLCAGENLDNKFLYYFCKTYNFLKHNKATTLPSLTKTDLLNIKIPLPPLPTQKKIAAILDEADRLRQLNQQVLDKYEALGQALFLEMFGDPIKNDKDYTIEKLGDITTKITDGVHAKPDYKDSGVSFISVKDITTGKLKFDKCKFISKEAHEKYSKRCNPEYMDILYTKVGATYGRPAIVDVKKEFSLYVSVALLKPKKEIVNPIFLKEALANFAVKRQADRSIKGIGVPDLHLNMIRKFIIPLPSMKEQTQFATRIQAIEAQKAQAQASLQTSEDLFNSLLQKAFKGELNGKW